MQSIPGDRITLPGLFRQNGYYTMRLGKIFGLKNVPGYLDGRNFAEVLRVQEPCCRSGHSGIVTVMKKLLTGIGEQ